MVKLVALRALEYRGRAVAVGEYFDAEPVDAAALRYQRKADFAAKRGRTIQTAAVTPEEPIAPTRRRRRASGDEPKPRTYRRRDMVPEP